LEGITIVEQIGYSAPNKRKISNVVNAYRYLKRYYQLYLLILPALASVVIFNYWPLYGIQIAFKDFHAGLGFSGSEWVGFEHFIRFFKTPTFWTLIKNTVGISLYGLIAGFPIPIILAFMINEVRSHKFKKTIQMITYAPYFLSTIATCGMLLLFLKKDTGVINAMVAFLGGERKDFILNPDYFWSLYVWSDIWKGAGWGTIIYLASLSAVSQETVEAAIIDGANRIQKIIHVDWPAIVPTIIILLILSFGSLVGVGYEKILLLQTSLNMDAADVLSTYTYRQGILGGQYDYTTAIGLLNSVVNGLLLVAVNAIARRTGETSLF
jgi:putative aldouronate transport system permease protein